VLGVGGKVGEGGYRVEKIVKYQTLIILRGHAMHAYYEVETNIPSDHQLQIQLPDIVPVGRAKISVLYELPDLPTPKTEDLINAIKSFRIKKPLSNQDIKSLCEEGRA
jgi:hypothetical protein